MATVPAEKDHSSLKEIGAFVAEMGEQYDQHAMTYAVALYLHHVDGAPRPATPPMHGFMVKAIKEVVLDVVTMDRRMRRDAA
jgi:hypothetical protein